MEIYKTKSEELIKKCSNPKTKDQEFLDYLLSIKKILLDFPVLRRFMLELFIINLKNKNVPSLRMKNIIETLSVEQNASQVEKILISFSQFFNTEKILQEQFNMTFKKTLSFDKMMLYQESAKIIAQPNPFTFQTHENSYHINYDKLPEQVLEEIRRMYGSKDVYCSVDDLKTDNGYSNFHFSVPPYFKDLISEIVNYFNRRIEMKDDIKMLSKYLIEFIDLVNRISYKSTSKLFKNIDYKLLLSISTYQYDSILKREYLTVKKNILIIGIYNILSIYLLYL